MKAAVYRRYGPPDVVRIEEVEKPVPGNDEILVRVRAASVNPLDWHFMRGSPYFLRFGAGLRGPKDIRLGVDVAGEVEAVGRSVARLAPGDAVFGTCRGAFAEYACAPESKIVVKPANVTFEQAACAGVAGFTALQGVRDKAGVQPGQKVLVNGAAGGVGTFAVQIAKAFGAEVTGVCSTRNVELVRSIGAARVVDYTREDFTRGEQRFDLIYDVVANHSLSACRRVLNPTGMYLVAGVGPGGSILAFLARGIVMLPLSMLVGQRLVLLMARATQEALTALSELMAAGKVTPVVDRRYPLSEVPEAIRYVEEGHARGKVVITLDS